MDLEMLEDDRRPEGDSEGLQGGSDFPRGLAEGDTWGEGDTGSRGSSVSNSLPISARRVSMSAVMRSKLMRAATSVA